jgi:hypothetical protein
MSPLELVAIGLLLFLGFGLIQVTLLYVYHYYFLVPLFKLMSYQSGVDIPPTFETALTPPTMGKQPKKEPRRALEGRDLQEMMDKLTNAY